MPEKYSKYVLIIVYRILLKILGTTILILILRGIKTKYFSYQNIHVHGLHTEIYRNLPSHFKKKKNYQKKLKENFITGRITYIYSIPLSKLNTYINIYINTCADKQKSNMEILLSHLDAILCNHLSKSKSWWVV